MAWICVSQDCSVKLFSVSEEIGKIVTNVVEFLFNVSPGIYGILLLTISAVFILYLFYFIKMVLRRELA